MVDAFGGLEDEAVRADGSRRLERLCRWLAVMTVVVAVVGCAVAAVLLAHHASPVGGGG